MLKIITIKKEYVDTRIDRWIKRSIFQIPQSLIERKLRNGIIKVNRKKIRSSYKLQENDKIFIYSFEPTNTTNKTKKKFTPSKKEIKDSNTFIVEDNENFCIINKPYGLAVQGGSKIKKNLVDLLRKNPIFKDSQPFIVHRIDKDTSGILIIAKNRKFAQLFTSLFRIRKIYKSYLSISYGEINKKKDLLDSELIRYDKDKKISERAITNYKVIDKNSNSTLLILNPITGRKHQIRKQLFSIGHPIIGDSKYNFLENKTNKNKNLMLHAYSIKFLINDKKFEYTVDVPDYFKKMISAKKLNFFKNI